MCSSSFYGYMIVVPKDVSGGCIRVTIRHFQLGGAFGYGIIRNRHVCLTLVDDILVGSEVSLGLFK